MKTPYQVQQELERLERLVPHIVSDQGDRAEDILGFHVASLLGSAPASEHALIRERTARMARVCRTAQDAVRTPARSLGLGAAAQAQLA
ncbi:hypothetical protein QSH39_004320 [Xanthomonas arboricola pv. corylina]|uniref:Uncharacterized protein n=1 Tax=Xanthomonas arboricola pv. corylina TaxID=487821 RepID=A0A8D6YHY4_9XANT|nr:hypothetical protein [Xanthomonas arboricola]MDN0203374.1 hypothetical protein [Xanthomonas arboricola pv. corylina]MDN0216441.1 hypothetical protein [Xanthomonas arboricola pv. corylina]MDN0243491.1 hypothetical protein [Xanthomonas arboricola pv. juglandis]MDN0256061.1 hypothetical protein [Xanthomonas arboricola pv. juglandis]MDN0260093.1 hypothetical protein [Xanthomonas arboricola pv. juglandis]